MAPLSQPADHAVLVRPVAWRGLAFRAVGHRARRDNGGEPCLAHRLAADQCLVVAHDPPAGDLLRSDDGPGDASRPDRRCGLATLSLHVNTAATIGCVARPA